MLLFCIPIELPYPISPFKSFATKPMASVVQAYYELRFTPTLNITFVYVDAME